MNNLPLFDKPRRIASHFDLDADIVLYHGDTNALIDTLPDNFVKLIVTSPPYNLGKAYEEKIAIEDYLATQADTIAKLYRVLHPNGSLCWQVGNFVNNGEIYPLDIFYYNIFKKHGLFLRNRIVWYFGHGLHASKRFSGR